MQYSDPQRTGEIVTPNPISWWRKNYVRTYCVAIALAVVPLTAFLFGAHNLVGRELSKGLVTQSSRSGKIMAALIERRLLEGTTFLKAFADRPDVVQSWRNGKVSELEVTLARAQNLNSDFSTIGLYNEAGILMGSSPQGTNPIDGSGQFVELYKKTRQSGNPSISACFQTEHSGYAVAIAVPVRDQHRGMIGVVVGQQKLTTITHDVFAITTRDNQQLFFVVDQTGQIFGKHGSDFSLVPTNGGLVDRLAKQAPTDTGTRLSIGSEKVIAAYAPTSLGWGVLVSVPLSTAHAAQWKMERQFGLFGGILGLLAIGGGFVVAATIQRFRKREHSYQEQIEKNNQDLQLRGAEAQRANSMKSKFLANMSHELRTPLNSILGFSELLHDQTAGPLNEKQTRWVANIRAAGKHLLQLINDILDLSKIEAGHLSINAESFALSAALPEVFTIIRPLAMIKQIEIHQTIDPELVVKADRIRLKQVLYNLLSNAVKFSAPRTAILLAAGREGEFCRISVRDQGKGIPPEHLETIFSEFSQIDDGDEETVTKGTGLGLAISRRLVERQGGTISVVSEVGRGTEFTFTVPISQFAGSYQPVPQPAQSLRKKPLVLVIDDEASALELLSEHLKAAEYDVAVAITVAEGLQQARKLKPDVITLDILMPSGSGWAVLAELKSDPATVHIPIVVVSILDREDVGFALGASDYLVKPVQKNLLTKTMTRLLGPTESNARVLIIDDNPADLQVMTELTAGIGYQTETAMTGAEGVEKLKSGSPVAVLLDLMLPDIDGLEILAGIRADPEYKDLPIVIVTGKELGQEELLVLERFASAHIHKKQAWRDELLRRLQTVLGKRRQSAGN